MQVLLLVLYLSYVLALMLVTRAICVGYFGCADSKFAFVQVLSISVASIAVILDAVLFGR